MPNVVVCSKYFCDKAVAFFVNVLCRRSKGTGVVWEIVVNNHTSCKTLCSGCLASSSYWCYCLCRFISLLVVGFHLLQMHVHCRSNSYLQVFSQLNCGSILSLVTTSQAHNAVHDQQLTPPLMIALLFICFGQRICLAFCEHRNCRLFLTIADKTMHPIKCCTLPLYYIIASVHVAVERGRTVAKCWLSVCY